MVEEQQVLWWRQRVTVAASAEAMSAAAVEEVTALVRAQPAALLCLATGHSPTLSYQGLVRRGREDSTLFSRVRLLKLDEWGGLAPDDPATCEQYLHRHWVRPLGLPAERFFGWRCQPDDPVAECCRVAAWLADHGPIDLSILGLGINGHLGFNEPADELQPGPHVAELSSASLGHSMLAEARGQVRFGLTLGMADILQSRAVFLLVSGAHKAEPLRRLLTSGISPRFPASFLALHPRARIFCDQEAAHLLPGEWTT